MNQKDNFIYTEADKWFQRNEHHLKPQNDEYHQFLTKHNLQPKKILEIGCANGYHLANLRTSTGADCYGIDPSESAINQGKNQFNGINLSVGTADNLDFSDGELDLVILGFCLYLCDREDLFKIASEVDRVTSDGGYILIKDFHSTIAYRNPYSHAENLYSYKMDYGRLFLWNPAYSLLALETKNHSKATSWNLDELISYQLIRKNMSNFELNNPYK